MDKNQLKEYLAKIKNDPDERHKQKILEELKERQKEYVVILVDKPSETSTHAGSNMILALNTAALLVGANAFTNIMEQTYKILSDPPPSLSSKEISQVESLLEQLKSDKYKDLFKPQESTFPFYKKLDGLSVNQYTEGIDEIDLIKLFDEFKDSEMLSTIKPIELGDFSTLDECRTLIVQPSNDDIPDDDFSPELKEYAAMYFAFGHVLFTNLNKTNELRKKWESRLPKPPKD